MTVAKTLSGMFKVIAEEAEQNPAFATRLEESLGKFADDYTARRKAALEVGDFHPFIEYKKDPDGFAKRLGGFDAAGLRLIVKTHGLDNAGVLKGKAPKKALVEHITAAAKKRVERDAKLFEY